MDSNFEVLDLVILIGYFIIILIFGIWSARKGGNDSLRGFFLAGRNMNWVLVGCGLFATNIGSTHFIGLTGSGAKAGIGISGFEFNAMFVLLLLGWVFVPIYLAGQVYTMPEYLRKRFGGQRIQIYLSVMALALSVFIRISTDLYAGTIFIEQTMKWSTYPAILALLAVSAVFTIGGGLTAVMWTDLVQTVLILAGAATMAIMSIAEVGGYGVLKTKFPEAEPTNDTYVGYNARNESCSKPTPYFWNLLRPATDPDLPWTGMTLGLSISAVWGWCSDQVQVQRTLCAKNVSHAKGGCILAGYLKILPLFLFVFPGMAARILFPNEMSCSAPEECKKLCGSPYGCNDIAYPMLVTHLMPAGAKGFIMSVMLAAIMSSLTSVFNSSSTLFTIDIWTRFRKNASEVELIVVGKVFIMLMVAISVAWMPVIKLAQGSQLYHYTQSVISYLAPPICSVYVLAVFWSRTNEKGAFWGLMAGLLVGVARFILEFSYPPPACASGEVDERPLILAKVHYLHFGCILFLLVTVVTVVVSLLTKPIDQKHIQRLTFWTRHSRIVNESMKGHEQDVPEEEPRGDDAGEQTATIEKSTIDDVDVVYFNKENDQIGVKRLSHYSTVYQETPSKWKSILFSICGFSQESEQQRMAAQAHPERDILSPEDEIAVSTRLLDEAKGWRIVCDVNGVLLLGVAIAIWVIYA